LVGLLTLPLNIILGTKKLDKTKILAYSAKYSLTKKKSLVTLTPGLPVIGLVTKSSSSINVLKLFPFVTDGGMNKLEFQAFSGYLWVRLELYDLPDPCLTHKHCHEKNCEVKTLEYSSPPSQKEKFYNIDTWWSASHCFRLKIFSWSQCFKTFFFLHN
jgi:hypothetical protein